MQLKALGIDDILNFDFMDPPPKAALLRSLQLLVALDALDAQGKLTETGEAKNCTSRSLAVTLSRLPNSNQLLCPS